jgi:hypothetical protein
MFVDPIRGARGVLVATAVFAAGACDDPAQNTDLRPDGPPEVLAVLVMNDAAGHLRETATYCAPNDAKRPTLVGLPDFTTTQICDPEAAVPADMVTDAYPDGWYIRVMFDELLDPDVEELEEIKDPETGEPTGTYYGTLANTKPVKLECESVNGGMIEVEYDGYYSPSGNQITWPLGPSLVIKPNHPELVATNKMCRVTLKDMITDKSGEKVPADQLGPYAFQIAPITPVFIDPEDGADVAALQLYYDNVYVQFNTENMDEASIACDDGVDADQCEFTLKEEGGAAIDDADMYSYSLLPYGLTGAEYGFGPAVPLKTGSTYTFEFREGAKVLDHCGVETTFGAPSVAGQSKITFTTHDFNFVSIAPSNGDTAAALRKLAVNFNNVIDLASAEQGTEWTLAPEPEQLLVDTTSGGDLYFFGNYRPGQEYTFTLKAGATVLDAHGATYTQAADKIIKWTVAPIALTSTSPTDNGTVEQGATNRISLSFNQSMNPASLDPTEWEVVDASGAVVPFNAAVTASGCAADGSSTSCSLRFTSTAQLPPGDYKFTLKKDATIEDVLASPTIYTQASDRVVNFTVVRPTPVTPTQCL